MTYPETLVGRLKIATGCFCLILFFSISTFVSYAANPFEAVPGKPFAVLESQIGDTGQSVRVIDSNGIKVGTYMGFITWEQEVTPYYTEKETAAVVGFVSTTGEQLALPISPTGLAKSDVGVYFDLNNSDNWTLIDTITTQCYAECTPIADLDERRACIKSCFETQATFYGLCNGQALAEGTPVDFGGFLAKTMVSNQDGVILKVSETSQSLEKVAISWRGWHGTGYTSGYTFRAHIDPDIGTCTLKPQLYSSYYPPNFVVHPIHYKLEGFENTFPPPYTLEMDQ